MSKHRAEHLPSHTWLFFNKLRDWLAVIFVMVLLIIFIACWTIRYSINRDCTEPYKRNSIVLGYWIHVSAGSTEINCPQK